MPRTMRCFAYAVMLAVIAAPASAAHAATPDPVLDILTDALDVPAVEAALSDVASTRARPGVAAAHVGRHGSASVPQDAARDVVLSHASGPTLAVGLPSGETADAAQTVTDGVVAFDNNDGSTTVPIVKDDASVQILTIVHDATAPERYRYELDVPVGSRLQQEASGAIVVLTAAGALVGGVAPPWAYDATGAPVPTRFEIEGTSFTQVVEHLASETTYPVVADPFLGVAMVSSYRWETSTRILVTPTAWARAVYPGNVAGAPIAGNPGFDELRAKQTSSTYRNRLGSSARNQYICHVAGAPFKSTWNLETNRADKGYLGFIASGCN
ncbi:MULTISPECIES: DUF2599 domain-containing protein [Cellulomonas]|uniref:DUF2599 domain-containing protein n=1 Tax=Cellulomonas avistercoris TaxID=2762242 RepID=A0ABR8QHI7_9CELL|nr:MULTISPECIES: DUF2599 domain-containing protein [Cellulomonas]MBD7919895.1 DUF2599 domain-containing protein [Cellulomonas avistercoris]SFK12195.1 Protein of unknown function [Cellulomonas sp. KH9]